MKPEILECKEHEYAAKLLTAVQMGDKERIRKRALACLMILRHSARAAHELHRRKQAAACALERAVHNAKLDGVTCVLTKPCLKQMWGEAEAAEEAEARVGERICAVLDIWEYAGATFEDLCNICNRNPEQVKAELHDERRLESLSKLAMIGNLDYKNPKDCGFIEDSIDAPFTHALKAYLIWTMLHTEEGKKAAHEAMNAVFPEIMENAMTVVTGEDGVQHLIDKDGEEVGILEDEDDF